MSDVPQIDQAVSELADTINQAKAETEILQRHTQKLNEQLTCYEMSIRFNKILVILNDIQGRVRSFDTDVIGYEYHEEK